MRYGECDPQGIVFNANYLLYFDVVFTELWRASVGPWQEMVAKGFDAVVAEARLRFRSPARFDDQLQLRAQVTRLGTSSITTSIDVVREDELLVAGVLRHVCVATRSLTDDKPAKAAIPDWIRHGLRRFALDGAQPEAAPGSAPEP